VGLKMRATDFDKSWVMLSSHLVIPIILFSLS
jgi:hypothetical protein